MSIKHFAIGALVWVPLREGVYKGKVLNSSDISTREHSYELFKVELEQTYTGLDGIEHTTHWIHPKPIQGYRLKKRVE